MSDTPRTDDQECDMFVGVCTFTPSDIQQAFDFARQLERELNAANTKIKRLEDCAETAWGIIANVSGGNWAEQRVDWREAAIRWRDERFKPEFAERKAKEAKP